MFFNRLLFGTHLAEGEKLLHVVHKHWIEIAKISVQVFFFGTAIPWLLWALFPPLFWLAVFWTAIAYIFYFYEISDWFFDAWLVTDISIIDVEWKGIFHHLSSRVEYGDIKEIGWEIQGFMGTIFRFGNMAMNLTVGSQIALENVNNPKKVELIIHSVRETYLEAKKFSNANALQEILSDIVSNHIKRHGLPEKKN